MWLSNVLSYFARAPRYTYLAGSTGTATVRQDPPARASCRAVRHSLTKQPDELGVTWLRLAHEAMPNEKVNRDERRVWLPHRQILPQRAQDLGDGQEAELLHLAVGA